MDKPRSVHVARELSSRCYALSARMALLLFLWACLPDSLLANSDFLGTGRFRLSTRNTVISMATADLNEDGLPDHVALGQRGFVTVHLSNDGGPFFTAGHIIELDVCPLLDSTIQCEDRVTMAVADFNGDENYDLAVAHFNGNIVLYDGQGNGQFEAGRTLDFGEVRTRILATGDVDGDGHSDLIISFLEHDYAVWLGRDDGTFDLAGVSPTNRGAVRGILGDFDNDRILDIATFIGGFEGIVVSLGNGDGTFTASSDIPLISTPDMIRIVDLDDDGHHELVTSHNSWGLLTILGTHDGQEFSETSISIGYFNLSAFGEFDYNDGIDLLTFAPDVVQIRSRNNDGTFGAPRAVQWSGSTGGGLIIIEDFDANDSQDVVVGGLYEFITVILGNGNGTFDRNITEELGEGPRSLATGDLDGDGLNDIVSANELSDEIIAHLSNGDGTFRKTRIPVTDTSSVTTLDFDQDGSLDLLIGQYNGLQILVGNGSGEFVLGDTVELGIGLWEVMTGDVDGNGTLDAIAADVFTDQVVICRNVGDGTLAMPQSILVGDRPLSLGTGDFDEDGRTDIVTLNEGTDNLSIIMKNGTQVGSFRVAQTSGSFLGVGDFDEDGHLDLIVERLRRVRVILGNGDGTFHSGAEFSVGPHAYNLVVSDFNSDTHLDLAIDDFIAEDVTVVFGMGDGTFSMGPSLGVLQAPVAIGTGDFDGDGRIDIASMSVEDPGNPGIPPEEDVLSILLNRINRPPIADIDQDRIAECTSPSGTLVQVDGSSSFDPDEDPLDFMWSAPNVSFIDPSSPLTTGIFPLGATPLTLAVSDGESVDADTSLVTVIDSAPPSAQALLARGFDTGPKRVAMLLKAQFSSSDVCDATPTIEAELQMGECGTLPVSNEQLIRFRPAGRCRTSVTNGILQVEAASLVLRVTATDDSGNTSTVTKPIGVHRGADSFDRRSLPRAPQIKQEPSQPQSIP